MDRKKRYYLIFTILFFLIINFQLHNNMLNNFLSLNFKKKIIVPNEKFINVFPQGCIKPLLSDYLWVKLIGSLNLNDKSKENGVKLYKYLMIVTELDPYFYLPYLLGGSFLTGKEYYNMFDKGTDILKKGVRYLPEKWQLWFLLGYFYFFEHNNKMEGYQYFVKCLNLKQTPEDIKKVIPLITLKFDKKEGQIVKLKKILASVKDESIKRIVKSILKRLMNPEPW